MSNLTESEGMLIQHLLPCPFCGARPRLYGRDVLRKMPGKPDAVYTERVLYVSCCGCDINFSHWQQRKSK